MTIEKKSDVWDGRSSPDLLDILLSLWSQRNIILSVTFIVTVGFAAFAFFSKPEYLVRVSLMPPALNGVAGFNVGRRELGFQDFNVDDVYQVFTRNLQSDDVSRKFFKEEYLPSLSDDERKGSLDSLYQQFVKSLRISLPGKGGQPGRYAVEVESASPEQAADWAKKYIDVVAQQSTDEVMSNVTRDIEVVASDLRLKIEGARSAAKLRQEDRISRLREAVVIAQSLGLKAPSSSLVRVELQGRGDESVLYLRGTEALNAELKVLEERKSNDSFAPNLRDLEERYNFVMGIALDRPKLSVFRQDGAIHIPDRPFKPKKLVLLLAGLVVGGALGVFIAFCRAVLLRKFTSSRLS